MMVKILRRRRAGYLLPSESSEIFNKMIGQVVTNFKVGTRRLSDADIENDRQGRKEWGFSDSYLGQPYFLTYRSGTTVVIYEDDFLGSVVIREVACDLDNASFFDILEEQDRTGIRTKIRRALPTPIEASVAGNSISAITAYKLPENFYSMNTTMSIVCECVVEMKLSNGGQLLFACQIAEKEKPGVGTDCIRLESWDNLDPEGVKSLKRIWPAQSNLGPGQE
ncbi:hypothetical protein QA648_22060 (plasmid) [Rhizobium sp. CB3171]|uniref:hypothetical protein n=1 Tax=Rhizobium sp. CB3171 TaxID=3039157 RepID=UPI0024B1D7DB|nr:hypothetical protein [Rhizobium sp. CB3171]WFU05848.1 hypothetical protein QA648_22060 [Rhizobium sp. CB3171]